MFALGETDGDQHSLSRQDLDRTSGGSCIYPSIDGRGFGVDGVDILDLARRGSGVLAGGPHTISPPLFLSLLKPTVRGRDIVAYTQARVVKAPNMASAAPAAPESTSPTSIESAVDTGDGNMPIDPGGTELDRSELVRLITQSLKTLGYG